MNHLTTTARLAALFAAVGVTTLLAASQLGLADHYAGQAGQAGTMLAQQAPAADAGRRPA